MKDDYSVLKSKALSLKAKIDLISQKTEELVVKYQKELDTLNSMRETYTLQQLSIEALKKIIDQLSENHLKKVRDLLTLGLQTIFYDRKYEVQIETSDKRGLNSASLFLVEERGGYLIRTNITSKDLGGSILTVVGFILQVFYIRYFKAGSILFLDETFTALSSEYVKPLVDFMHKLSQSKGFIFVFVSHDDRFIEHADRVYQIKNGCSSLLK
jgi:hypothetical protein